MLLLGIVAASVLVLAELSPVYTVELDGTSCQAAVPDAATAEACDPSGGRRHSYALLGLALAIAVMAVGAGPGRSVPAAVALIVIGGIALAIALLGDLPVVNEPGVLAGSYEQAEAAPASGFWLSLVGGAMAVAAGLLGLVERRS